jgi:hypothetical protein
MTAAKNAAANHSPYGILITTTPGDLLTNSGRYAYEMRNNAIPWNEMYYDYTFEQMMGLKQVNKSSFFLISYTYQQLGSGSQYFNDMVILMERDWPAIRREILLEWAETATDCPFSTEDLDIVKSYLKQPIRTILFGKFGQYQFNIYEDIDTSYPPIVGVDVSGCTYKDASAITVIDSKTTRVGATMNCNYIPADDLAQVVYELVSKYLPNAIINIETNGGYGSSVVAMLKKTSVKSRLYWEIKDRVVEERFDGMKMVKQKQKMRVYCLYSTPAIRNRLIEILFERMMYHKDKFIAPILHQEMQSMVTKKNGKVEHSDNSHDDQVFSYLMALWVWYDGKNLAENWGIQKNTLKTDSDNEIDELTLEDNIESVEKIDPQVLTDYEEGSTMSEINKFLEENSKFTTSSILSDQIRLNDQAYINQQIIQDPTFRKAYSEHFGLSERMLMDGNPGIYTQIPAEVFDMSDDDFNYDDDDMGHYNSHGRPLAGNLSPWWTKV